MKRWTLKRLPGKATQADADVATGALDTRRGSWRKKLIISGVVVAFLVAAVAGGLIWHRQPSFCNAICHKPMDSYVQGYNSGNADLLVTTHKDAGKVCLDCHESKIGVQVTEAVAWVKDSYVVDQNGNLKDSGIATRAFCLRCHDYNKVSAATADWGGVKGVNPHSSPHGYLDCGKCHSVHGTPSLYCNGCHDWKLPAGGGPPATD